MWWMGGRGGYIRRRELTLQGTIEPSTVVNVGDTLEVVVLELANEPRIMELSRRRALPDPWAEFGRQAQTWDKVRGTVKYVKQDRVVVEIQPGVDGTIAMEDLFTEPVQRPEEVVWPGDWVEATILRIDPAAQKLQLSIRHQLERGQLIGRLLDQMGEQEKASTEPQAELPENMPDTRAILNYTGQILVAEDDPDVRVALTQWLESAGCQVTACSDGAQGLESTERNEYSLLFTDIDMPSVNGITLAQQIRQRSPETICVFLSDPDHISQYLAEIEALGGYVFTKPLDTEEIHQFLNSLATGELPSRMAPPPSEESTPFRLYEQRVSGMRSTASLPERIGLALAHLLEETGAEKAILFHYDPISRLIQITAQEGPLSVDESQVNSLIASPVEDVITEDGVIWVNRIPSGFNEGYKNLLRLLPFQACIGIPVSLGDERSHALFIFHRHEDVFSRYRVRDVQAAGALISVALEEDLFRNHMRHSSALLLTGQLSSAFNHEIYNKISVLDFQLDMLTTNYKSLQETFPQMQQTGLSGQVNKSLAEVTQAVDAIKRMAEDFRQIIRGGASQSTNINQVIRRACEQVNPAAERAHVTMIQELDDNLPDLRLNRFALIYVVYNLLINAVQHLENHPNERQVKIQTGAAAESSDRHLFIRVADSGPGIHCQLWDKIFELGYTTRPGGSGLGLYIARSLVETLGGKIYVEESLIHTNTVFRIEIPEEAASHE